MKYSQTAIFRNKSVQVKFNLFILSRFRDEIKISNMYWQKLLEG